MTQWLIGQGEAVNRKRVQRLMRLMGLEAIYPKPRLVAAGPGPQDLPVPAAGRGDRAARPGVEYRHHLRAAAIGFMYLAAMIDWYSRYVVAWRLSNTLDGSFCLEMLEEALRPGQAGGVQHRPGGAVHGGGVDGAAGAAGWR